MRRRAWSDSGKGQRSLKRREERGDREPPLFGFGHMYNRFRLLRQAFPAIDVPALRPTRLLSSPGCCNLLSAWPDYRLLRIVWWRAAGWRDGWRRGDDGGMEGALIFFRHIRKITFFINVSIWTLAIFSRFLFFFLPQSVLFVF